LCWKPAKTKTLDHKAILNRLKLCIQLLELHDENPFKIRSYQGGLNALERLDQDLMAMNLQDLAAIPGIGKSILEAIQSLKETGSFPALDALIGQTPAGVLEILQVKGLGPKKVQVLWKELGLTSTHELMEACQSGKVAQRKPSSKAYYSRLPLPVSGSMPISKRPSIPWQINGNSNLHLLRCELLGILQGA
jgi:DNA polymerase (family 10)